MAQIDTHPTTATEMSADNVARALVDLRDKVIQRARVQFGNRLAAIERGADISPYAHLIDEWHQTFEALERELDRNLAEIAQDMPIVAHMTQVKGVGQTLAIKVAAMIDIERADTVSALWRYAGYAVIDGERERPRKGERRHYNARLKTACYLVGASFLKSRSPYRRIYDNARAYYEAKRPDWTKAHQHNAAMRKMIKVWLSHLHTTWRVLEGLDVRRPYVNDHLGHDHIYRPIDFGWEPLYARDELYDVGRAL